MIKYSTLFILFFGTSFLFSQTLKGKIIDAKGEPVAFAKVRVHQSSYGTVANAIGLFQLENLKDTLILQISALGYETKLDTIILKGEITSHNCILNEVFQQVDEVVVVSKTKKERGKEIMKEVIEKRPFFYEQLKEFSWKTYCLVSLNNIMQDYSYKSSIICQETKQ